jgi:hypothetical protein
MFLRAQLRWGSRRMNDVFTLAARTYEVHAPVETHRAKIDGVVLIQRWVRGILCRVHTRHKHFVATTIQKHARIWLARRYVHRRRLALGKMQALVDEAYRKGAYVRALSKIARFQDFYRMRLRRREFLEKRHAQILIARIARGKAVRKRLVKRHEAAHVLTRRIRTWYASRKFQQKQQAALRIQCISRGFLDRDDNNTRNAASARIAASYRRLRQSRLHQARCRAGATLVYGAIMSKHMKLHKRRIRAATKIAAVWQSYCVRVNLQIMDASAQKIQRWWRALQVWRYYSDMAVEVLVRSKLLREAYLMPFAITIQRSYRRWRELEHTSPLRRAKRGIIKIQSHYRRRQAARHVEFVRKLCGVRLKCYLQRQVILMFDSRDRLTRSRVVSPEEDLEVLPPSRCVSHFVDISRLSARQHDDLGFAVAPIQALGKWQFKCQRVLMIQRVWSGYVVRKMLRYKRKSATRIQVAWRAKVARRNLRRSIEAAVKIQANMRRTLAVRKIHRQQEEEEEGVEYGAE